MIDLGLTTGIKDIWQENLLRDYTLIVEGHEFQVHKVVLAAVSKYFKAMLGEAFVESEKDKVKVKGFSSDIVSKLLDFIYTGEESIIADDTLEVLRCSMYLQMPLVSQFCVKKLLENLNVQNCLEVLSAMIEFTFPEEVTKLKDFIQRNWEAVMENFNPEAMSSDIVQVLMDCWQTCEWDKFLFVKKWICQDYDNCISFVNSLMSKVRFCLISLDDLESIMDMKIFSKTDGSWKALIRKAVKYHQMPANIKVMKKSEQFDVKTEPLPAFFFVKSSEDIIEFFTLDEKKKWVKREQKGFKSSVLDKFPETVCLDVNNFLIVCRSGEQNHIWQIFDPRTLSWSTMPNMERTKHQFAMVYHKDILYIVGGEYIPDTPSYEMEQYSFLTNKWKSIHKMPASLKEPAVCVLEDTIYVSGGWIEQNCDPDGSDGLYCLDLSSDSLEWDTKASCLWTVGRHQMCVLKRSGEEGLFIFDLDFNMQFYSPSKNQWSEITNTVKPEDFDYPCIENGMIFVRGYSVFILKMHLPISGDDGNDGDDRNFCCRLTIPERGRKITKVEMEDFPQLAAGIFPDKFGAVLAIPSQVRSDINGHHFHV